MSGLEELIARWRDDPAFMRNVTRWEEIPAREGSYEELPSSLDPRLRETLRRRGIERLYSHQAAALRAAGRGENIVVVTPTASGKTLCYNIPVVNEFLADGESRAIYLFPTKALSQDQLAELKALVGEMRIDLRSHTYDGDTAPGLRQAIRQSGHIVVTNPDMLHTGILPHHTKWAKLFQNLNYIVIDEMHQYRGVFGSHVANVIRRLKRICRFYERAPRFILCSATIANPAELAEALIEEPVTLIDNNGAPRSTKHFIFYNPPVVDRELGIRRSALLETQRLARELYRQKVQTIVFTRSRLGVELLLTYLQQGRKEMPGEESGIRGYRGGYLPRERRSIEAGLREGSVKTVVSTNALELGIDIGELEACLMNGYPGTIASTWQQAGRSGRRSGTSLGLLVANSEPLNQYIINNPDYFFGRSPERALINPDNLIILTNHVRCAAFELPFRSGESFGRAAVEEILQFLAGEGTLYHADGTYHWMEDAYPAEEISLRSAARENVVIIDISTEQPQVIGEVDRFSAPMLVHEEAIYIHGGRQYQVERLDFAEKKAYVRAVRVNYFTDANLSVDLKVLDIFAREETRVLRAWGEVRINALVSMFKKIRFHTHENLGTGPVNLPETEMHTTAFWIAFPPASTGGLAPAALETGLLGLANLIPQIASLFIMGDPRDLRAVSQVKAPFTGRPTLYLYDNYPGGVGYSELLYRIYREIFKAAREAIINCRCSMGCPSCVGAAGESGADGKSYALQLLEVVLDEK
ncbi:MAG TPA: DEAD/DEAH box helicase [Bacillota bacterium]|jgi:DEAD/DEAH box helicase domain-containing protein|nr:DEAD/DEAH box helicase [Bacillota bacterium]HOA34872.1 DEAD/DEAH box helicase [Bacillota bacterium]HPZ10788.1 DEAD/DEAH box helicase [Bacillota bacterium]HQE08955.1 DEAD/DEAH box helicase [Bacillota bacterium]